MPPDPFGGEGDEMPPDPYGDELPFDEEPIDVPAYDLFTETITTMMASDFEPQSDSEQIAI